MYECVCVLHTHAHTHGGKCAQRCVSERLWSSRADGFQWILSAVNLHLVSDGSDTCSIALTANPPPGIRCAAMEFDLFIYWASSQSSEQTPPPPIAATDVLCHLMKWSATVLTFCSSVALTKMGRGWLPDLCLLGSNRYRYYYVKLCSGLNQIWAAFSGNAV